jgi:hypothetical protein
MGAAYMEMEQYGKAITGFEQTMALEEFRCAIACAILAIVTSDWVKMPKVGSYSKKPLKKMKNLPKPGMG